MQNRFIRGGITTNLQNSKFVNKLRFPKSKKPLQRYLGFLKKNKTYISRMIKKLNPFYKHLKAEITINITPEVKKTFDSVNKALNYAFQLALKQPILGKRLVLMTDESFRSAGYALFEYNQDQKIQRKKKPFTPVAFGINTFPPHNTRCQFTQKFFGKLHCISRVCTQSVGSIESANCLNGQ